MQTYNALKLIVYIIIEKSKKDILKDKHFEFKVFESYVFNKYEIYIPNFNENLLTQSNEITNINITADDIKKAISFIKKCQKKAKDDNAKCFIFKIEELENELYSVVKIANNLINKITIND